MRLKNPSTRQERGPRAAQVLASKGEEIESEFSVTTFFTPNEWDEIRRSVFRSVKDYGVLQDRLFLSLVSNKPEDQFQPSEQEELFSVGDNWVKGVVVGEKEVNVHNWKQALHCSAIVALAFPEKRKRLSVAPQIKELIHQVPGMLLRVDRLHKKGVGLRVLLHDVRNYLVLFPEDRDWVMQKLKDDTILQRAQAALAELADSGDWTEFTHLGAELRLLSPDSAMISHLPKVIDHLKQSKQSHKSMLYTLLPDVLDVKMLAAERAELDENGRLRIVDRIAKHSAQNPLPTRLVA